MSKNMNIFFCISKLQNQKSLVSPSVASLSAVLLFVSQPLFAQNERAGISLPSGIEEIVVTGQKRNRTLQATPASVAVITPLQIEQQNINSFDDALFNTANTHATPNGGFSIRGIDGFSVSGGGNSYLASVYVDGAALPERMVDGGSFSTWDAEQIEVFRGPQSTLQGRNALAGAIMMTTQKPNYDWSGKVKFELGNHGKQVGAVALGGGLVEDQLAVRLSAESNETDGYIENVSRDEPYDFRRNNTYRLKFLYEPSALPGFSSELSWTRVDHARGSESIEIIDGINPFDNRDANNNDKREQFVDSDFVVYKMNFNINENWNATALTTWSEVKSGYTWDIDLDPFSTVFASQDTGSVSLYDQGAETLSQEVRFNFEYDQFDGIVGLYYSDLEVESLQTGLNNFRLNRLGLTSQFLQGTYGLDSGTADLVIAQYASFDPARTQVDASTYQKVESLALFADVTWVISEQWDLFAGLRWDNEKQENANSGSYIILNDDQLPDPASYVGTPLAGIAPIVGGLNAFLYNLAASASQVAPLSDAKFDTVLPKLGVSYHLNDEVIASFSVQEGYRSGGVGINSARSEVYTYDPESTINYELSLRTAWLDGTLVANANVFYIDWKDQQVNVQLSASTYDTETRNAGSSTVQGFELELNYRLNSAWELYSGIGLAKSEFTDFTVVVPTSGASVVFDLKGRSFPRAPEWTGNLGATYYSDSGFFANVNMNYANKSSGNVNPYSGGLSDGDRYFDLQNEARTLVNFQFGYEWESVGVYLIGSNIFDEEYITAAFAEEATVSNPGLQSHGLGAPRQLSLTLRSNF